MKVSHTEVITDHSLTTLHNIGLAQCNELSVQDANMTTYKVVIFAS